MDKNVWYRTLIKSLLLEIANPIVDTDAMKTELVFDDDYNYYHYGEVGWCGNARIDIVFIHIDLIGDMIWIQYNGTERSIAASLVKNGVPPDHIVLGFKPPHVRPDTEYATG